MLTANQPNGPATFVAINNMFSTPSMTPLSNTNNNTNNTLLSIPTATGLSNLGPAPLGPNSFLIPSANFTPNPNNLTCTVPFSGTPQIQNPFLSFFGTGSLTGPLNQYVHPGTPMAPIFPSSSSLNSPPMSNNHLLQPPNNVNFSSPLSMGPVSSTMLSTQGQIMLPTLPVSFGNNAVSCAPAGIIPFSISDNTSMLSSSSAAPMYTATLFPLASPTLLTTKMPSTASTSLVSVANSINSSQTKTTAVKSESKETLTTAVNSMSTTSVPSPSSRLSAIRNLQALEAADYHRDAILDAIDKLRDRKARPDFERISCLLKRYQNINPEQTQLCLGKLADAGAVVCVDYKGNLSYRNPSKWRKTAAISGCGVTNLPSVSQRLVDSVQYLTDSSNGNSGSNPQLIPPVQPGPNGGFSLFQIERALQTIGMGSVSTTTKNAPELTGATLRVCLDREATHGRLAKTQDGRYILDETGERKKSNAALNASVNNQLFQKKAIPPNVPANPNLVLNGSVGSGLAKYSKTFNTAIAPADPNRFHPLAARQSNNVSIAPGISGKPVMLSTLPNLSVRPLTSTGRRGRPPGSKAKKSLQADGCVVEKVSRCCAIGAI